MCIRDRAAVELVGYGTTSLLEPGQSETVTVSVPEYFLTSYDALGTGVYILEDGTYYLTAADNSHEAANNILAAKGYTTADGMTADGDTAKTYTWNQETLDAETCLLYTSMQIRIRPATRCWTRRSPARASTVHSTALA